MESHQRKKLGVKFRRQYSIGNFIADFYCSERKLVVELDGKYHDNEQSYTYDQERTKYLNEQGISVIRFTGVEIYKNLEGVLSKIKESCKGTNHPGTLR